MAGAGTFSEYFQLDKFITNFKGGLRSYMFFFIPNFPSFATINMSTNQAIYLVRSTSTPAAQFEIVQAAWQGFDYKAAGRKTFADFTVTFNCDNNAYIYKTYHKWHNEIRKTTDGKHKLPNEYMVDQNLQLLNPTDPSNVVMEYILKYAWPSNISEAQLDHAGNDITQFSVTFTYQYYTLAGITES